MLRRNTVYLSVMHRASSRSDRPGFYGRREEPLTIVSRDKVDPGLPFTALGSVSGLLLVPCGYYYIYRRSQEIIITRDFYHWTGAQDASFVSTMWSITKLGYRTEPKKLSRECHLGLELNPSWDSGFFSKSYEQINEVSRSLCSLLQKVRLR